VTVIRHPEVLGALFVRRASKDERPRPSPFAPLEKGERTSG
jgi:hypothetical protein